MKKKVLLVLILSVFMLFFIFGKINLNSLLKTPISNELRKITSADVSVESIYLNLIPLYFEIKDIKIAYGKDEVLKVKRVKLYPGFGKIFNGEIEILRTVVYDSEFSFEYNKFNLLIESISKYIKETTDMPILLTFKALELKNSSGVFIFNNDKTIKISELNSRLFIKKEPELSFLTNLKIMSLTSPPIEFNLKASLRIQEKDIILQELKIFDLDSLVKSEGRFNYPKFMGEFVIGGKIFVKSLLRVFQIHGSDFGELNLNGKIKLIDGKNLMERLYLLINFDGYFMLEEIMKILKVSERLEGYAQIYKAKLEGSPLDFNVTGEVYLKNGNILGVKVEKVQTKALYKKGILYFTEGKLNLYGGKATADVWITLPKVFNHYVFLRVNSVSSSGIFELINWNPEIPEGKVDGWLRSEGRVFSPEGSFVYIKKSDKIQDLRGKIRTIRGDFKATDNIYRFNSLEIEMDKTITRAVGYFDSIRNYINFNFKSNTTDINELIMPYQKGLYGNAHINGSIVGNTDNPELRIGFILNRLLVRLEEISDKLKSQILEFNNAKGVISYSKARLNTKINGKDFSISGDIIFPEAKRLFEFKNPLYDLSFTMNNIEIKKLPVTGLNELISTNISIAGNIKDNGKVYFDASTTNLLLDSRKIADKAMIKATLLENSFLIKKADFYVEDHLLHAEGFINFDGKFAIKGHSQEFDITKFSGKFTRLFGVKYLEKLILNKLNFKIEGSLDKPEINASSELSLKTKNAKYINGSAFVKYTAGNISINTNLLKGITLKAEGIPQESKWHIDAKFSFARVDPVLSLLSNSLPEDLVVLIDGKFEAKIEGENIDALINLPKLFMRMYGIGLNNKEPIKASINKGNIQFEPIKLIGQSTELTIKGKIVDYYDVLIDGNTDLRPLKAFFKADDIKGRASTLIYIYGQRNNPEIIGELDVNDSAITIRKDIPTFNNINAVISFNENRAFIEKASGNFSQGKFNLEGSVYLENFALKQIWLSGNFSDVRWIFTPKAWAYLDGQVYLTGDYANPLFSGSVRVSKGIYSDRLDWTKFALRSSSSPNVTQRDGVLSNLKFNLRVITDKFFVNNNLATVNLDSDIVIKGTVVEPLLIGWINAKDGWIYFRGNKFELSRLLIQFTESNPVKPYINISARTAINQYNVNLNINGYIDQFNLMLSSNPPLAEQELLNLLVLGQNGVSSGGMPGASEAASFITGQMEEVFQERIRGITGLDVMTVEPYLSKKTGAINPRITVGKKLLDGKMTVTYSTATGATAEQTIKVEYLVKRGVYLVGTKDETGGISGAIKFRFEFR
ncbi:MULTISPECIES: translocation/assembly module TamB domain-containing protein [Thermodesulfovibrio]|uniref:translocation/assembly module TamB domain-containing protein n=1 Tax=Thermodesulfovibrio TaxID=28261 RepID=UPI002615A79E|nr:translocation/assembly module TamB domain-containing protein [Thermodesulfovibrio sp.]